MARGNFKNRRGISVSLFARTLGVTEGAVRARVKSGKMVAYAVFPDGSLDPSIAFNLWRSDMDFARSKSDRK